MIDKSAERPWERYYQARYVAVVAESRTMRVLDATLGAGERVPWHYHTHVDDHFWVVEGNLRIETRSPSRVLHLAAGGYCLVPSGCPHLVVNAGDADCRFINLQGVGCYDFVLATGAAGGGA